MEGLSSTRLPCIVNIQSQSLLRANLKKRNFDVIPFLIWPMMQDLVASEFVTDVDSRVMLKTRRALLQVDMHA